MTVLIKHFFLVDHKLKIPQKENPPDKMGDFLFGWLGLLGQASLVIIDIKIVLIFFNGKIFVTF